MQAIFWDIPEGKQSQDAPHRKFAPLTAQAKPEARPGAFVCFSVTDEGCGMDEATIQHIFEPFFTTKEVGKGTGLGLATVHGIVKQHAGWIEVESALGRGTTFHVYLPAAALPESAQPAAALEAVRGGTETILVVEDEAALRDMVLKSLERYGYRVVAAGNGPEALLAWQQQEGRIDLLFTDFVMPGGMNGLELAHYLQLNKPALKLTVSSGYTGEMEKVNEIMGTAVTFFPKPYDVTALAAVVRKCLDEALLPTLQKS